MLKAKLGRTIRADLAGDLFTHRIDAKAKRLAEQMGGQLLLVSNVAEMASGQVVPRYKAPADIERGFRVLEGEIEIGPVHHRLPERIRAHATVRFVALIVHRVMRGPLHEAADEGEAANSPERALERLRRIQRHEVQLGGRKR